MQKLVLTSLLMLVGCNSIPSRQAGIDIENQLIGITDLYAAGHEQIELVLKKNPSLGHMLDSNLAATLLITLIIEYEDGEKERVQQSGCFIQNGKYVLTAGHGFYVGGGRLIDLQAQTISLQKLMLNVVALGYSKDGDTNQDWAILRPVKPNPTKGLDVYRSGTIGKDVYLLGFPGGVGLDDSSRVVHTFEMETGSVYPIAVICERSNSRPNILTPRVGAIPVQGISGAPVLSGEGELIGLFSSISRTRNIVGWHYIFHMSELPLKMLDSLAGSF